MKKYYSIITIGLGCLGLVFNAFGADEKESGSALTLASLKEQFRTTMEYESSKSVLCKDLDATMCNHRIESESRKSALCNELLAALDNHRTLVRISSEFGVAVYDLDTKKIYRTTNPFNCTDLLVDQFSKMELVATSDNYATLFCDETKIIVHYNDFPVNQVVYDQQGEGIALSVVFTNGQRWSDFSKYDRDPELMKAWKEAGKKKEL